MPVSLDGQALTGPQLVDALGARCEVFGVGRSIHVGETVLGIKGRVGFEAGAALTLIADLQYELARGLLVRQGQLVQVAYSRG